MDKRLKEYRIQTDCGTCGAHESCKNLAVARDWVEVHSPTCDGKPSRHIILARDH